MEPRLLLQLALVCWRDEEAIRDSYAWPPRGPLSDEEKREAERLRVLGSRLAYRARAKGGDDMSGDELWAERGGIDDDEHEG